MRNPFLPPPEPGELLSRADHELVRDFPELLPLLGSAPGEESSGELGKRGGEPSSGRRPPPEALLAPLGWRGRFPA